MYKILKARSASPWRILFLVSLNGPEFQMFVDSDKDGWSLMSLGPECSKNSVQRFWEALFISPCVFSNRGQCLVIGKTPS